VTPYRKSHNSDHSGALYFPILSHICPIHFPLASEDLRSIINTLSGLTIRGSNPEGGEVFHTRPQRPWDKPSLYTKGTVYFPSLQRPAPGVAHPHPSMVEFKERVALHIYSALGDVTVLWRFNARSDGNLDVVVTNKLANIPLSNRSNIMYFCSVFVKI
jgi:hypothetical protein